MFQKSPSKSQYRRDFRVSLLESSSAVTILVGPRFLPHRITSQTADFPGTLNYLKRNSTSQFDNFYSPESSNPALFEYLKTVGREKQISQYFPGYELDGQLIYGHGAFEIPRGQTMIFWIKSPFPGYSAYNPPPLGGFADLDTRWARLEFGTSVPANSPGRTDINGRFSYTLNIPAFSVRADGLTFEVEYFDIGELRYFSDDYVLVGRERFFNFSGI